MQSFACKSHSSRHNVEGCDVETVFCKEDCLRSRASRGTAWPRPGVSPGNKITDHDWFALIRPPGILSGSTANVENPRTQQFAWRAGHDSANLQPNTELGQAAISQCDSQGWLGNSHIPGGTLGSLQGLSVTPSWLME